MFSDRSTAGRRLADILGELTPEADAVVAVPGDGIRVGRTVAETLALPFDVVVTRNLYAPGDAEVPIGAVTDGGTVSLDDQLVPRFAVVDEYLAGEIPAAVETARAGAAHYRGDHARLDPAGRTVIVVADAVAERARFSAVVDQLENAGAERVVVATPVACPRAAEHVRDVADDLVCLTQPLRFEGVRAYYGTEPGGGKEPPTDSQSGQLPAPGKP